MRTPFALLFLLAVGPAFAGETLPRNPFWPQGYEGTRYAISPEPRFRPEPAVAEPTAASTNAVASAGRGGVRAGDAKKADPLETPLWDKAVKALHFGSAMRFSANGTDQAAIMINGRAYVVGDFVSANAEGHRFTWRIESLASDAKIKLKRITYRKIGTNP